jgi:hypothetical protein
MNLDNLLKLKAQKLTRPIEQDDTNNFEFSLKIATNLIALLIKHIEKTLKTALFFNLEMATTPLKNCLVLDGEILREPLFLQIELDLCHKLETFFEIKQSNATSNKNSSFFFVLAKLLSDEFLDGNEIKFTSIAKLSTQFQVLQDTSELKEKINSSDNKAIKINLKWDNQNHQIICCSSALFWQKIFLKYCAEIKDDLPVFNSQLLIPVEILLKAKAEDITENCFCLSPNNLLVSIKTRQLQEQNL